MQSWDIQLLDNETKGMMRLHYPIEFKSDIQSIQQFEAGMGFLPIPWPLTPAKCFEENFLNEAMFPSYESMGDWMRPDAYVKMREVLAGESTIDFYYVDLVLVRWKSWINDRRSELDALLDRTVVPRTTIRTQCQIADDFGFCAVQMREGNYWLALFSESLQSQAERLILGFEGKSRFSRVDVPY